MVLQKIISAVKEVLDTSSKEKKEVKIDDLNAINELQQGMILLKNRKILERAAITCPVGKSLHEDIKQEIIFKYSE